jgi:hypothetical protein
MSIKHISFFLYLRSLRSRNRLQIPGMEPRSSSLLLRHVQSSGFWELFLADAGQPPIPPSVPNDLADYMAKMGVRMSPEGPGPFLPIATIHVKRMAANIMQQRWTREWAIHTHCNQTKIFFPTPDPSRSRDLLSFTRKELGILISHLTGHCFLRYHRNRVNRHLHPECSFCMAAHETSSHIIKECPAIAGLRRSYMAVYYLDDIWEPAILLDFLKDPKIAVLEEDEMEEEAASDADV